MSKYSFLKSNTHSTMGSSDYDRYEQEMIQEMEQEMEREIWEAFMDCSPQDFYKYSDNLSIA